MAPPQIPPIGVLQGRLTPSPDGRIQFFPRDSWEEEFPKARGIGFSDIEILIQFGEHDRHPMWTEDGQKRLKEVAAANGIGLPSVHGFFKWRKHADESVRALECIIPATANIGASAFLLSFFDENAINSAEDKNEITRVIKPLADLAQESGVKLGLEVEMKAEELKDFIQGMSYPAVGVYYDIGNMASMGVDVPAEIKLLGPLVVGAHVKDRVLGGETVPLGEGAANFPEIFRALRDVGYAGPLVIQGARDASRDDVELNWEYYQRVREWRDLVWA